jgi:hypothetical protein
MKTKPDTDQFKPKKDPSAFLEGGTADLANQTKKPQQVTAESQVPTEQPTANTRVHREQKIFRLPLDLINALKRESYERSVKTGTRVTETELVEQAIRAFLDI